MISSAADVAVLGAWRLGAGRPRGRGCGGELTEARSAVRLARAFAKSEQSAVTVRYDQLSRVARQTQFLFVVGGTAGGCAVTLDLAQRGLQCPNRRRNNKLAASPAPIRPIDAGSGAVA